jgi:hypothetical protein
MRVHLAVPVTWGPIISGRRGYVQLMRAARARSGEHDSP